MKIIQETTSEVIISAITKLVDLVKPTYGPAGNKVIIGKGHFASVLDDGVQIAKDLVLEDEAENYVLKLIKEVAIKTNERVGDGTTSSLILLKAIMLEALKSGLAPRAIVKDLDKGLKEAIDHIKKQSTDVKTEADLEAVARISFDNEEIAKLLAEIVFKIGENGLIDVQPSQGSSIESEIVSGFKIESGYVSPYMATDGDKCIIEDSVVLAIDKAFHNNAEIVPIMEMVVKSGQSNLVVFCKDFGGEALTTAILNKVKGGFRLLAIKASEQDLNDVMLLTGAKNVLNNKVEETDFGYAKKIVARIDSTVIIDGRSDKNLLEETVEELKKDKANDRRVANLTNSVAVIKVGGKTESESKALLYKIEDASNAVKVAYKGGVVGGAGSTLRTAKTSSEILNKALKEPYQQLKENIGDFTMNDGIIDPTEVVIAGLESAVSIAKLLITTTGLIYDTKND